MHALLLTILLTSLNARRDGTLFDVPVRINGHGPYWFCVDTGASHTVIDPRIAKEVGVRAVGRTTTRGTGEGEVAVERAAPIDVQAGAVALRVAEPWLIDLSGVPIAPDVRGLIGAEFLEAYVVELDAARNTVRFFDRRRFTKPRGAVALPLEDVKGRFFTTITIDVNAHERVERRVRIDSGSSESVADPIVKNGRHVRETMLGQGLGRDFKAYSGVVDAVHLGPFTIRDVWGPGAPNPAIGMELLRRFTVTFDASRGVLCLKPNAQFTEPVPPPPEK